VCLSSVVRPAPALILVEFSVRIDLPEEAGPCSFMGSACRIAGVVKAVLAVSADAAAG
jgi:hypothetical protein